MINDIIEITFNEAREFELLKKRQKKHLQEHQRAFEKEVNIIKNDLYHKFIDFDSTRWFFDISYQPMEYLSGDSYSIRMVYGDEIFLFIVDAMGKGLSASIASMISASFLNYLVDEQKEKNCFYLEYTVKKYIKYIQNTMFDEEIISVSFILFDPKYNTLTYALFGTPPILLCDENKNVTKIKNNNLPIAKYHASMNIDQYKLGSTQKLLIYSDGLSENITDCSNLYTSLLENDFKNALNCKDFLNTILKQTSSIDDDMTFFYIEKFSYKRVKKESIIINSRYQEVSKAIVYVEQILQKEGYSRINIDSTLSAFSEILQNSYEHGSLELGYQKKCKLLEDGVFESYLKLQEEKFGDKSIKINLFFENDDGSKSVMIEIVDSGDGFDTEILKNSFFNKNSYNGRGLQIVKKMVDGYYSNSCGNRVIIKKIQKKEEKAYA